MKKKKKADTPVKEEPEFCVVYHSYESFTGTFITCSLWTRKEFEAYLKNNGYGNIVYIFRIEDAVPMTLNYSIDGEEVKVVNLGGLK